MRVRLTNRYDANSSSNAFASFRSRVSNPSVNQPQTESEQFARLVHVAPAAPAPREAHLTASTREGRTAEVSKCHAAGHLVAVNSAIEFQRQRHRVGNRYLPR